MGRRFFSKYGLIIPLLLLSFTLYTPGKVKVYLIGDSTMANKLIRYYPETGWGMPFSCFFDSTVVVDNRAQNGRSTRTFMQEGRWQPVVDALQPGDYVLIQFGHNDEIQTKKSATTEDQFRANLTKYVNDTKSRKAYPVLITPVARRNFDTTGVLVPTHEAYSAIVRSVARDLNVPLIDLDKKSQALLTKFGVENSKLLYNHLEAGEHPNYPSGKVDDTHFSELGARKMAQLVLEDIRALNLGLAQKIIKR